MGYNPKFAKKAKTQFKVAVDTNRVYDKSNDHVLIALTFKDLEKFYKIAKKRHLKFSKNKKLKNFVYFNHLSPDVSFLVGKK